MAGKVSAIGGPVGTLRRTGSGDGSPRGPPPRPCGNAMSEMPATSRVKQPRIRVFLITCFPLFAACTTECKILAKFLHEMPILDRSKLAYNWNVRICA